MLAKLVPFSPYAGPFAAYNSFDSGIAGVPGVTKYCTKATYNSSSRSLVKFAWIARWDTLSYPGSTQPRTFAVEVKDSNDGVVQSTTILFAASGTKDEAAPWRLASVQMSNAVNNAKLCFVWTVPQSNTGPANAAIDNVALACAA